MPSPEISAFLQLILRWFHVFAGVIWIGHLYFFNFVNVPFQGVLEKELKPKVNPALLLRALWWFRWGAMWTFLIGWLLFGYVYLHGQGLWDADGGLSSRGSWMLVGAILGSIMWFNVWFVIWPSQKRIFGLGVAKAAPEELPALRARAALFSKINTYLSGPMLFGMLAATHYSAMNPVTLAVFAGIGLAFVWSAYKISPKVGKIG